MLSIVIALVILGGIAFAVSRGLARDPRPLTSDGMAMKPDRVLIYAVSFAGLMAFLLAVAGLVTLLVGELFLNAGTLMSADDARNQASYYLAALIVGTPLWLGFWMLAQRRIARHPEERQAPERRLYLAAAFAVTSVVALFGAHTVLRVLLEAPWSGGTVSSFRDGVEAGIRLAVYGVAWAAYTRLAWSERGGNALDSARDLALWVLSASSLAFLSLGLVNGVAALIDALLGIDRALLLQSTPASLGVTWADIAAWVLSGGIVWAAVSRYAISHPSVRAFRVPYLYLVLTVAVGATLIFGVEAGSELLRRAFGYAPAHIWAFTQDVLPPLLVGGALWLYHWRLLRNLDRSEGTATIPGERRLYLAALTLTGLAMAAFGGATLLWLVLEALIRPPALVEGGWWRDGAAIGISLLAIGVAVWIRPWGVLSRAAAGDLRERTATERRWLLGAIVLVGALVGSGFAVALLWQVFQVVLGGPHGSDTILAILKDLSAALIAAVLAVYHGNILRGDIARSGGRTDRVRLTALIAPGGLETLNALREGGRKIEVAGYLEQPGPAGGLALAELKARLASLDGNVPHALLVLGPDGGSVLPYRRNQPVIEPGAQPNSAPRPVAS